MGKPAPTYKSFGNLWKSMGFLFRNDLLSGWMFQSMLLFYRVPAKHHGGWKKTDLFAGGGSISQGFEETCLAKGKIWMGKTLPLTHRDTLINEVVILEGTTFG